MAARAGGLASVGGMPRLPLVAVALVAAALLAPVTPAGAKVRTGPAGTAFYRPPSPLPKGAHGAPIWARRLTGDAALRGARTNELLLYRSVGVTGKPVAVSGSVTVPKGRAPNGGWPVV